MVAEENSICSYVLEYDAGVTEFSHASKHAYKCFVEKSDQQHWCSFLFDDNWCGEMYCNVIKSFNAWVKEVLMLPVTKMDDMIR